MDRPAGTINHQGYLSITFNGIKYHGPRLAWYFMTGEWPSSLIGYKDNDPRNLAWDNLKLITHEDRLEHYRQVGDILDKKPLQSLVPVKPVKRATFSNSDVAKAVEEFIRNKTLTNGRYE